MLAELVISQKESPRKCTLTPFRRDPRFRVHWFNPFRPVPVAGGVLLHPDGPPLAPAEVEAGLILVDGSWRYAARMVKNLVGTFVPRSLPPGLATAYVRRARGGTDPATGLASIEALYGALWLAEKAPPDLLAAYRWREEFLALNAEWFARHRATTSGGSV